jgi:hypothetical protein
MIGEARAKREQQWIHPLVAVGHLRNGRRGWYVLGPRAADGAARPVAASGYVDRTGVHVVEGILAPRFRVLLLAEAAP